MKRIVLLSVLIACLSAAAMAQTGSHQQGTIVRMRMTDCLPAEHGFMTMMSGGSAAPPAGLLCPEYVLLTDTVVYSISGKNSDELLPLAESTSFRLQKNEMLIRVDDTSKESHFRITAMITRVEWDRTQSPETGQTTHAVDTTTLRSRQ